MLQLLPDLRFPITRGQIDPLMNNIVQLNLIEAGLTEKQQRGLGLLFHLWDTFVKSHGKIDYRSPEGHARLVQDAMTYLAGSPVTTRHGDLPAAHLAIDYSDTQIRLRNAGKPPLPADVATLLYECRDLSEFSPEQEKRIGLLLDMLGKRPL